MHPNADTITKFYAAFAQLDPEAMGACYADDVRFDDEVFSLRGKAQTMGMWRMLCEATRAKGKDDWKLEYSGIEADANDRPRPLGRPLPLQRHRAPGAQPHRRRLHLQPARPDRHAPRPLQLLGLVAPGARRAGLLLGWTPMLRNKVKQQAAHNLRKFMERKTQ
jgi:hypothetical protein